MNEQIDLAEVLEVLPPALPTMVPARELMSDRRPAPPQIVRGVLHQTCKLLLSGTSKSNKSWSLLDLAASVASGQSWWGHQCEQADVVYLNFELADWAMRDRLTAVLAARPECIGCEDRLFFWNLRGHNADLKELRPRLEEQLSRRQFGLIIIDPIYKLLGDRDENSNGEIAGLMNEVEAFCQKFRAAVAIAHHFAKGDSTAKNAIDRMSGAGVWARDPDSLVTLTPHEEDDCFSVNMTLRNLPRVAEFVVRWEYPLMRVDKELNPRR
jgi:RecA-family ATPase